MKTDVVVIGSGVSGLTAAALLAKSGRDVVLVEHHRRPGGSLKRFKRSGVPFDIGFHYTGCLGQGEVLRSLWEYLDLWPRLKVRRFPADGCDCVYFRGTDRVVHAYFSYDLLQEELCSHFPQERRAVRQYLGEARRISETIPFYNLDLPLTPFLRGFWKPALTGLKDFLTSLTANEYLHSVLALPGFLYGVPADKASLGVHDMVAHAFLSGAYAVDGGGQAIVDAFLSLLEDKGVRILTRTTAREIQVKGGRVNGLLTSKGEIQAREIVFTGHPSRILEMVPDGVFRPAYCHRIKNLLNTRSMFVVFGELIDSDPLKTDLVWKNFYLVEKGLGILETEEGCPENGSLMMTAPGKRDTDSRKSGADRGVILMRPASWKEVEVFENDPPGSRSPGYEDWKRRCEEALCEQVSRQWAGGKKFIRPLTSGSPMTFRDELLSPRGAVYGAQHCLDQVNPGARTRLPGLYLSGQSTLMTGVVGASLSALVTVGEMTDLERLWDKVRKCR